MKVLVLKKGYTALAIITLALILCFSCITVNGKALASVYFGESFKKYPIYNVNMQEKKVAITFDAAWGADKTLGILEILKEFDVKATFFLVGIWVEKYKEETKAIIDSGCEIGSHSYNHPDFTKLTKENMLTELTSTNEILESVTGVKPKLFRPPYGAYNNTLIECLESLNMQGIQWDTDTLDWKGYTPSQVIARVNNKVKGGSIILCHNNADHVLDSTRLILSTLKNKGYEFVTVGELTKDVKSVKIGVGQI